MLSVFRSFGFSFAFAMRAFFAVCFICLSILTMAQDGVRGGLHFGSMIAHRNEIRNLNKAHLYGAEINVFWNTKGNKRWHKLYAYPQLGVDVQWTNMNNKDELGQQLSLSPYIDLPLQQQPKKINQWLKLGFGLGYANTVWDLEDNVKALVIGSHFNAAIGLQYAAEIKASKSVYIRSGIRISHFSNASFKLPNLGTNNFTLFLAASFERGERMKVIEKKIEKDDFIPTYYRKWTQIVSYNMGFRENFPPGGPKHAVHTLRYRISKTPKRKSSWGLFAEGTYNRSLEALLYEGSPIAKGDLFQSGIGGVYGLHFGKTQFDFMTGLYLVNKYSQRGPVFNRFGIQHQFTAHFRAQMMLKTHYSKADHFALGIAYQL